MRAGARLTPLSASTRAGVDKLSAYKLCWRPGSRPTRTRDSQGLAFRRRHQSGTRRRVHPQIGHVPTGDVPLSMRFSDSIEDGADRAIMAWPSRPGGGFASALAMREARASGRLAHATLALWPWRSGATWAARSVLVHPAACRAGGGAAADEMHKGAAWAQPDLAHNSLAPGDADCAINSGGRCGDRSHAGPTEYHRT